LNGYYYYPLLLPGKRSKSPGTRDASAGSSFVQKLPCGNILQSVASLVADNCSSFVRGETVRPPLKMSDTKSFTLFLTKDGYLL
jgi:hypothetical protein